VEINILLDTNAYSALKRGHQNVAQCLRRAEHVHMSTVVIGELLFGFRNGTRLAHNQRELEEFLSRNNTRVIDVTTTSAARYSRIATYLRTQGTPIPTNDIWIAAHAFETGAALISFDQHFANIDGLVWQHPDEM
jgi:tRNA(fMet)-specific endonuclease VapC